LILNRPYTPLRGGISNVWFDRLKISNDCPEHLESIDVMCQVLTDLIDDEVKTGIKKNRILVGKIFRCWQFKYFDSLF
jgi:phospholipase/carboxylesterase